MDNIREAPIEFQWMTRQTLSGSDRGVEGPDRGIRTPRSGAIGDGESSPEREEWERDEECIEYGEFG